MAKLAVLPAVVGCLLLGAPHASSATPADDAASALRTDSVYLDPAANRNLDVAAVRRAIGDQPIKIAVIPRIDSVNEVAALPRRLAATLPGNTIAVISGRYFYAGSEVVCKGAAGLAAAHAINGNEAALDLNNTADSPSDITKPLTDFVAEIRTAPRCPADGSRTDRYADEPGGGAAAAGRDDTATVLPWVLAGVGVGVLAIGTLVLLTRRRTKVGAVARRDEAGLLVHRLSVELDELPSGADSPAAQARNEAAAMHGEADAILLGATTDEQFAAARRAAIEGLLAARSARLALGQEAGPAIPEIGSAADATGVTEPDPTPVRVSGDTPATGDRR